MKNIIFTILKIFVILIFVAFILEEYFVIKEYKNDDKLIYKNKKSKLLQNIEAVLFVL